jgi:hypothetical protein
MELVEHLGRDQSGNESRDFAREDLGAAAATQHGVHLEASIDASRAPKQGRRLLGPAESEDLLRATAAKHGRRLESTCLTTKGPRMRMTQWIKALTALMGLVVLVLPNPARGDTATRESGEPRPRLVPQTTISRIPSGVDTYTAFIEEGSVGAAGVGLLDGRPSSAGGIEARGGVRTWASFLDRVVMQAEAGHDSKSRFVPSLAVAVRALGDRERGWAFGVLGRYRTEGFTALEGEVEGGLLGGYAKNAVHLDAGLVVGVGIEEEEADGEALARFGYDVVLPLRVGFEGRLRRELREEEAEEAETVEGGEWDAFAGAQATLGFEHVFGILTAGVQKSRLAQEPGWMTQLVLGGIAF